MPLDGTYYVPANDPTLNTLIEMRRLIEQGWIKGRTRSNGKVCLVGAYLTAYETYHVGGALKELSLALYGHYLWPRILTMMRLAYWNDKPKRTKDDVLELLDRAIELRRNSILEVVERGKILA